MTDFEFLLSKIGFQKKDGSVVYFKSTLSIAENVKQEIRNQIVEVSKIQLPRKRKMYGFLNTLGFSNAAIPPQKIQLQKDAN